MKKILEFIEKIGFLIKDIAEAFRCSPSGWGEVDIDKVKNRRN